MAYVNGTATDYIDLLDRLITFLTTDAALVGASQNWTTLSTANEGYDRQYFMRAPGLTGTESIYINFRTVFDITDDWYNWEVQGAGGYAAGTLFNQQPSNSPSMFATMWNNSIPYWFIGNGQRVIVIAKISTTYLLLYYGKILPYGTPGHFPYPVLISSNTSVSQKYSLSVGNYGIANISSPGDGAVFFEGGAWNEVKNRNSDANGGGLETGAVKVWPTMKGGFFRTSAGSELEREPILPASDGTRALLPFELLTRDTPSENVFGQLDGVYWVTGQGSGSEDIITISTVDHMLVQNMQRTTWDEFAAVRLT